MTKQRPSAATERAWHFRSREEYDREFAGDTAAERAYFGDKISALLGKVDLAIADRDPLELDNLDELLRNARQTVWGVVDAHLLDKLSEARERVADALERQQEK